MRLLTTQLPSQDMFWCQMNIPVSYHPTQNHTSSKDQLPRHFTSWTCGSSKFEKQGFQVSHDDVLWFCVEQETHLFQKTSGRSAVLRPVLRCNFQSKISFKPLCGQIPMHQTNNKNLEIMSLPTCKSVFESYSMYHLNHHKSQDQKFIDTKTNVKWQTLEEFYLAAFQTLCDRPGPWPPDEDKNNGWDWCRLVSRKVTASIYYNINIPIFLYIFYLDFHQRSVHITIHTRYLCHDVQKPLPWASTR